MCRPCTFSAARTWVWLAAATPKMIGLAAEAAWPVPCVATPNAAAPASEEGGGHEQGLAGGRHQ